VINTFIICVLSLDNTQQQDLPVPLEPEHTPEANSNNNNNNNNNNNKHQTMEEPRATTRALQQTSISMTYPTLAKLTTQTKKQNTNTHTNRNIPLTLLRTSDGAKGEQQRASQEKVDRLASGSLLHVPASGGSSE